LIRNSYNLYTLGHIIYPNKEDNVIYVVVWGSFLLLSIISPVVLMTINVFFKSDEPPNIDEKIKQELSAYIKKVNDTQLDTKKCILMLNSNSYISLKIPYRKILPFF